MDYARADRAEPLAAEYVLGTLRGPARRRLEALLPAHPALRGAVARWRERLDPLALSVPAVEPPERVWHAIQARLFEGAGATAAAAPGRVPGAGAGSGRWWDRLALWRGLSGAAVLGLAVLMLRPAPPAPPPLLVVLAPNPAAAGPAAVPASFAASLGADGRTLVLRPLQPVALPGGRALELWAVPAQGAPRSMGLVRADGQTVLSAPVPPRQAAAWAVSVEPAGGSPSGAPTGPIVALGPLES